MKAERPESLTFIERLVTVEHDEWPRLALAFFYFFFLLCGYFMLRPLRGTIAANNTEVLHWLYTGTFLTMLSLVPVFGFLVSRFRRGQFIPAINLFFIVQLVLFATWFEDDATPLWMQRSFYIWLSVFNLFVVSIFWSFMADIFRPGQAQRLFGFIMAGGSIGAIIAPSFTKAIVTDHGASGIMYAASGFLVLCTILVVTLGQYTRKHEHNRQSEAINLTANQPVRITHHTVVGPGGRQRIAIG